ncbi:MAG: hypothetical protein JST28_00490 [Acidobacteria bacterium]|nr:hypothetical protein [Acidobacteriota bacterium]
MYNECRHILLSGHKCRAAALKGKAFCYHHLYSRRLARMNPAPADPLLLPSIEDIAGVNAALNQVIRQYGNNRMDRQKATTLFYGLQIAASLVHKSQGDQPPGQTVREICEDEDGGMIAPESTSCEPPEDCKTCAKRSSCKTWRISESDFPGDFFSPPPTYKAKALRERLALKIRRGERIDEERREIQRLADKYR